MLVNCIDGATAWSPDQSSVFQPGSAHFQHPRHDCYSQQSNVSHAPFIPLSVHPQQVRFLFHRCFTHVSVSQGAVGGRRHTRGAGRGEGEEAGSEGSGRLQTQQVSSANRSHGLAYEPLLPLLINFGGKTNPGNGNLLERRS